MTVFIRVLDPAADNKPSELKRAVGALAGGASPGITFEQDPSVFSAIPGSPFAYWLGSAVRDLFRSLPKFESEGRTAKIGASTKNNFRFLRLDWEVEEVPGQRTRRDRWVPFAKGGKRSPFYADIYLLVKWELNAQEIEAELLAKFPYLGANAEFVLHRAHPHFRAGATWTLRASRFAPQFLPAGCVFSDRGYAAFVPDDDLAATVAVFNSQTFDYLYKVALGRHGFPEFIVGTLQSLPWKAVDGTAGRALASLARRAWSIMRSVDSANETSHAFLLPPGILERVTCLDRNAVAREMEEIQNQIDEAAFSLYGISAEDRAAIEASGKRGGSLEEGDSEGVEAEADDDDDEDSIAASSDAHVSWLVGVAFKRFDPRLATGERIIPPEPEPFDQLPGRYPGMYPRGEEPADRPNILVDDEGHANDLAARTVAVAERVHVDVPEDLRSWLAKEFFAKHIKMYSRSRRKAPIYWQIATPSASYSVWLYIHAFNKDTLFRVQNDYAAPKLAHEERRLESLTGELAGRPTAAQRKELAAQESLVEELRAFLDEVKRVAPLWKPNLDDGVVINFAPLWRLVPQNKSWQKELRATWDSLCEGKFDWAQLAMHLWPERAVPKCAKDRSLAIAHGLEDVFWVEGSGGNWSSRKTPSRSVDDLVRERTSPAVKAALRSLLEAPVASAGSGRGRGGRRRGTTAADEEGR